MSRSFLRDAAKLKYHTTTVSKTFHLTRNSVLNHGIRHFSALNFNMKRTKKREKSTAKRYYIHIYTKRFTLYSVQSLCSSFSNSLFHCWLCNLHVCALIFSLFRSFRSVSLCSALFRFHTHTHTKNI